MGVQVPAVKVSRVSPRCRGMSPTCRGRVAVCRASVAGGSPPVRVAPPSRSVAPPSRSVAPPSRTGRRVARCRGVVSVSLRGVTGGSPPVTPPSRSVAPPSRSVAPPPSRAGRLPPRRPRTNRGLSRGVAGRVAGPGLCARALARASRGCARRPPPESPIGPGPRCEIPASKPYARCKIQNQIS